MIERWPVVLIVVLGAGTLLAGAWLGARGEPEAPTHRRSRMAPLVPWLGSTLVVVLLVRGAYAGAVFVGLATLLHAAVSRFRTTLR